MSIATAISAAQDRVANAYTAISAKGGTLPATQNLANMPAAIQSIPSGGSGVLETVMENVVAGNNPVDTTALNAAETSIAGFLEI